MRKAIAAILAVYRDIYDKLGMFISIFGVLAGILLVLFASHAALLSEAGLVILGVVVLGPVAVGLMRSFSGEDIIAPPDKVRDFVAVSYAQSTDANMRELSDFAMKKFRETFPAQVDVGAVRNGSALGLRLTEVDGRNIGFLDVYHFRDDILTLWRQGEIRETNMTLDHFVPISSIVNPAAHDIKLVLGALYIDTSNPVADHHLAYCLIEAAREYLGFALKNFPSATIYATIFNEYAGARWAHREGFELDTRADKRGIFGGNHDVFRMKFKPEGRDPRKIVNTFGRKCEYRVSLQL